MIRAAAARRSAALNGRAIAHVRLDRQHKRIVDITVEVGTRVVGIRRHECGNQESRDHEPDGTVGNERNAGK